jgi:hypothetical protein
MVDAIVFLEKKFSVTVDGENNRHASKATRKLRLPPRATDQPKRVRVSPVSYRVVKGGKNNP